MGFIRRLVLIFCELGFWVMDMCFLFFNSEKRTKNIITLHQQPNSVKFLVTNHFYFRIHSHVLLLACFF